MIYYLSNDANTEFISKGNKFIFSASNHRNLPELLMVHCVYLIIIHEVHVRIYIMRGQK